MHPNNDEKTARFKRVMLLARIWCALLTLLAGFALVVSAITMSRYSSELSAVRAASDERAAVYEEKLADAELSKRRLERRSTAATARINKKVDALAAKVDTLMDLVKAQK